MKRLLFTYICLTAAFATFVYSYAYLRRNFYTLVPQTLSVPLGNGFIYKGKIRGKPFWGMTDREGRPVVSLVTAFKTHGRTVYGQRDLGIAGHAYVYFICTYGEDCADTQNYGDVALNEALKKIGLPPFNPNLAEAREDVFIRKWLERIVTLTWRMEDK